MRIQILILGFINPLSPKSVQHQIFPCNVNALKNKVVMGITDVIRGDVICLIFNQLLPTTSVGNE